MPLLHDYAFVRVPADRVVASLRLQGGGWMSALAARAVADNEDLHLRVGPLGSLPWLSKTVSLHAGEPIARGDLTVVPLTWRATGSSGLFPSLRADLEVAPLAADTSQLTLRGSYDPPLGELGRRLDRALMHRVAEATIRSFMHRLTQRLIDGSPTSQSSVDPTEQRRLRPAEG